MSEVDYLYAGGDDAHYHIDRLTGVFAEILYKSDDDVCRMFSFTGDSYRVVSSSIILGALADGMTLNVKPYLLCEIINYFLNVISVSVEEYTEQSILSKNYPNPFNDQTKIEFTIKKDNTVKVEIFNLKGQMVKRLIDKQLTPGNYSTIWNGTNEEGNMVENGFYFYKLTVGNRTLSEKMILFR
ncbi:MAG: T9SS type A sorting domain-containing protein [Bacteroidales bacterium]|nr:T9SS type A sorting domain-containing protein [Bacteroidales bacterium]